MPTKSKTVADFLDSLPAERRREMEKVRRVVRKNLPKGYEEVATKNMLVYQVPLAKYAETYNRQPLYYAALSTTKSGYSLHLLCAYGDKKQARRLEQGFQGGRQEARHGQVLRAIQDQRGPAAGRHRRDRRQHADGPLDRDRQSGTEAVAGRLAEPSPRA
jgi:hypothetical protein